jgi:hypothetical protein
MVCFSRDEQAASRASACSVLGWRTVQGISFGLGDVRKNYSAATMPELTRLIRNLERHRKAETEKTNHALYRAAPQCWLETLVLEDPSPLDAHLDANHLYSQVPALAAGGPRRNRFAGSHDARASGGDGVESVCYRYRPWIIDCEYGGISAKVIFRATAISRESNWTKNRRWCGWLLGD